MWRIKEEQQQKNACNNNNKKNYVATTQSNLISGVMMERSTIIFATVWTPTVYDAIDKNVEL